MLATLRLQLKDIFKAEYAKRDAPSRIDFSRKLLADAAGTRNADQRFVMLVEARDISALAGDTETAFGAIGRIVERYDVGAAGSEWSSATQKMAVLAMARKTARSRDAASAIAAAYLEVAREGQESGDYDIAADAARDAGSVARIAGDQGLADEAGKLARSVKALEKEFKGVRAAERKLTTAPDDPEANLSVGRFTCFVRGDWEKGLSCLAKGADAGLKAAALKDLSRPQDVDGQAALGDAWLALSKKERGAIGKAQCQARALEWYEQALAQADGFAKLGIEKKVKAIPPPARSGGAGIPGVGTINLLRLVDPAKHTVSGTWVKKGGMLEVGPEKACRVEIPQAAPDSFELEVVFVRTNGEKDVCIFFPLGSRQVFLALGRKTNNWNGIWMGGDDAEGAPPNKTLIREVILKTGREYRVLVRASVKGPTGRFQVDLDGRKLLWWAGKVTDLPERGVSDWPEDRLKQFGLGAYGTTVLFKSVKLRRAVFR
jgi:hypothetical protein